MVYNIRYHIASLLSVFIALAIGLVLGGLVVNTGTFDEQSNALIKSLREEFDKIHEENALLAEQNKQLEALSAGFVDTWAADRLAGQTVYIMVCVRVKYLRYVNVLRAGHTIIASGAIQVRKFFKFFHH